MWVVVGGGCNASGRGAVGAFLGSLSRSDWVIKGQFGGADAAMRRRGGARSKEIGWRQNQDVSDSLHRKASCCEVRLGPMFMLAPQRGHRQAPNSEMAAAGSGRGCWMS